MKNKEYKNKLIIFVAFILILGSSLNASITRSELDIQIYINDDGSAHVIENNEYQISGEDSINNYQNGLKSFSGGQENRNDITYWLSTIGSNYAPSYHIDADTGQENVVITPSQITYKSVTEQTARAKITVEYDVLSIQDGDQMKGVFFVRKSKPRTMQYILNADAIRFEKNEGGDFFPPENTVIEFIFPKRIMLESVKPSPNNLNQNSFPIYNIESVKWDDETLLPKFSIVFTIEQRLDEEMADFFRNIQDNIIDIITGQDGWAVIIIALTIVGSYVAMQKINSKE